LTPLFAAGYLGPLLMMDAPGHALWSAVVAVPVTVLLGEVLAWVGTQFDTAHRLVTEREAASAIQARRDPMTGLGNRRALHEWLAARAALGCTVGVVYLDLNGV
jgi:predicted signal transduction protein with EAL and GGDEF domain